MKVAEDKFNEEQQRLKDEHENETKALEELVEEKQKYITNLELQLKTLKVNYSGNYLCFYREQTKNSNYLCPKRKISAKVFNSCR